VELAAKEVTSLALLELTDVSKFFGGVKAVDSLSFSIEKGETLGLIGPNGAGKTTVFNLITGLYPLDGGKITFKGEDISQMKAHEIIPRGIARTFQNLRLFPRASSVENVMTACRKESYSFVEALTHLGRWMHCERNARERAMKLLNLVGIADRTHQAAGTLPYGHQRKLEIARALALEPELLLLDEPSLGLAPILIKEIFKELKRINGEGVTMLLVEQNARQALALSNRGYVLQTGRIVLQGPSQELLVNPDVTAAYLGKLKK